MNNHSFLEWLGSQPYISTKITDATLNPFDKEASDFYSGSLCLNSPDSNGILQLDIPDGYSIVIVQNVGVCLGRCSNQVYLLEPGKTILINGPTKFTNMYGRNLNQQFLWYTKSKDFPHCKEISRFNKKKDCGYMVYNKDILDTLASSFNSDLITNDLLNLMARVIFSTESIDAESSFCPLYVTETNLNGLFTKIWSEPSKQWNLSLAAEQTNYSIFHLSRLIYSTSGKRFTQLVQECRLRKTVCKYTSSPDRLENYLHEFGYSNDRTFKSKLSFELGITLKELTSFVNMNNIPSDNLHLH